MYCVSGWRCVLCKWVEVCIVGVRVCVGGGKGRMLGW